MGDDLKKYNYMENVLQQINAECIRLVDTDIERNNKILREIIETITSKMKEVDPLFKKLYSRVFFGGSYFDGLKVEAPEEYDLDLLLSLPKFGTPKVTISNKPGFVNVRMMEFEKLCKQPEYQQFKNGKLQERQNLCNNNQNPNNGHRPRNKHRQYRKILSLTKNQRILKDYILSEMNMQPHERDILSSLLKLMDDQHYLLTTKVSAWIEGVISKALNSFTRSNGAYIIPTNYSQLTARVHKGGPAFTLKVTGPNLKMDVDLVPCIVFTSNHWPEGGYRGNPVQSKPEFFVVPRKPKSSENKWERCWRLSFQEQERVLIANSRTLKPTLRLLKRLRDTQKHSPIASYFIKTIFLWEMQEGDPNIFTYSLSYAFMKMLVKLQDHIETKKIPYFWNKNNNLLNGINDMALTNIANTLKNIIRDIDRNIGNPQIVVKYLRRPDELMSQLRI